MSPYSSTTTTKGIGFPGLLALAIVLITLKLLGKITWSWWWVVSPLWIPIAAVIAILAVALLVTAMFYSSRQ